MNSTKKLIASAILLAVAVLPSISAGEQPKAKTAVTPCADSVYDTREYVRVLGISKPKATESDAHDDALINAKNTLIQSKKGQGEYIFNGFMTERCYVAAKDAKTGMYVAYAVYSVSVNEIEKLENKRQATLDLMEKELAKTRDTAPSAAPAQRPPVAPAPGLLTLDKAFAAVTKEIGSIAPIKTDVAVMKIETPGLSDTVSNFLTEELVDRLIKSGRFNILERVETSLNAVSKEHVFQLSGMVNDKKIVGVGNYKGAKTVITGSFSRYDGFSQLRLAAIDVKTAERTAMASARIRPDDQVLAGVIRPASAAKPAAITEDALANLNAGKDLLERKKYDEAIGEFTKALTINKDLTEAYLYRGSAYDQKGDKNKAAADYKAALQLINPTAAAAKQDTVKQRAAKK